MTEFATQKVDGLDSFEKLALAFTQKHGTSFLRHVDERDLGEVAVEFARIVSAESSDKVSNFRIYPVHMKDEYRQAEGTRAHSRNTQIRTRNGNMYFAGYSMGK
ncbi:hypothetical protein ACI2KR_09100 [Pseudomonas luteola]